MYVEKVYDHPCEHRAAEQGLRDDPVAWATYVRERDAWLHPDLAAS